MPNRTLEGRVSESSAIHGGPSRGLSVSVIVPVNNGGEAFAEVLGRLRQSVPAEIIVVDDGSTDGSAGVARRAGVRVLASPPDRPGPGHARNFGARAATGDLLLFIDADVLVQPDIVTRVVAVFESPGVDALIGSYDDSPVAPGLVSQYRNLLHHYVHQKGSTDSCTFWSGCGAIRRDVFISAGGYCDRYERPSIEDIELGYRLTAEGRRIVLCKDLQVTHAKRWTFRSMIQTDLLNRALPWSRLMIESRRFVNDLNTDHRARIKVALTAALLLLTCLCMYPMGTAFTIATAAVLFVTDLSLWRFFVGARGWVFALATVPLQWMHYLICGVGFATAILSPGAPGHAAGRSSNTATSINPAVEAAS